jgi:hypothetical protein
MWLQMDHPWRKRGDLFNGKEELEKAPRPRSGEVIDDMLENWEECPLPGKKHPRTKPLHGALLENASVTTMAKKCLVVKNVNRPPHVKNQAPEYF